MSTFVRWVIGNTKFLSDLFTHILLSIIANSPFQRSITIKTKLPASTVYEDATILGKWDKTIMLWCTLNSEPTELQHYTGPQPTGSILFKNVNCTGDETKLVHCQTINHQDSQFDWPVCTHSHSVGVGCATESGTVPTEPHNHRG